MKVGVKDKVVVWDTNKMAVGAKVIYKVFWVFCLVNDMSEVFKEEFLYFEMTLLGL